MKAPGATGSSLVTWRTPRSLRHPSGSGACGESTPPAVRGACRPLIWLTRSGAGFSRCRRISRR
eukprot:9957389-Alexandrium_andersonii.AAC.1